MVANCDWVDVGGGTKAYYGAPEGAGPHPCIVVFIEAFGVNEHFKKLTKRLVEEGFATITPDIYGGEIYAYDDLDGAIGKLKTMDDDTVMEQTKTCLDWLENRAEADSNRAGVTGFCMGGRFTFLANAQLASRFKGAAAFYGGGIGPIKDGAGRRTLLDRVEEIGAPILLWYGSEDQSILPDELGRIAEKMAECKKHYSLTCFPNVGHGFFCEDRESYDRYAAETSFKATVEFFRTQLV
ncbi:MAG: carboxymethylenebutenolidase [Rhodospirillaceae bacterium]|nr:carboxymethylenebutenolidase [Rhodospirillaceae bacterium]|tara:strand:+ start:285 stop:1001 length:717 start_codon:yes stop_codon:yes gene_type:complete